jgi:hypothetical protein
MAEAPTRRRRFQFSLGGIFVAVAIVGVFAAFVGHEERLTPFPDPEKQIKDVELALGDGNAPVRLSITDPTLIGNLIVAPFHKSRRDPGPAEYVSLGTLYDNYADGSVEGVWVFFPWGRYKFYDEYRIADLSSFRDECRRMLLQSSDPEATRFLNDARLWR